MIFRNECISKWKKVIIMYQMYLYYHSSGSDTEERFNIYIYRTDLFRKPWKIIQFMLVRCLTGVCLRKIWQPRSLHLIIGWAVFIPYEWNSLLMNLCPPSVRHFFCLNYKSTESFQKSLGRSYTCSTYK